MVRLFAFCVSEVETEPKRPEPGPETVAQANQRCDRKGTGMAGSEHFERSRERRLPRSKFGAVRRCARNCWIEAKGDKERAIELVESRMESIVGSMLLSLAIQIDIKLIIWWWENRKTEPSVVSELGEPGTSDEDLDEWDDT